MLVLKGAVHLILPADPAVVPYVAKTAPSALLGRSKDKVPVVVIVPPVSPEPVATDVTVPVLIVGKVAIDPSPLIY